MKSPFTICLHHVQNCDLMHGQGNGSGYWSPAKDRQVSAETGETLQELRAKFEAWRDRNGIGAGNMGRHCGEVRDCTGKIVARFSYNGRCWQPGEYPTPEIVLP